MDTISKEITRYPNNTGSEFFSPKTRPKTLEKARKK